MRHVTIFAAVCITGCAAPQTQQPPVAASTCSSAKECEIKWAAARRWINDNCGYKLQHYTSEYMETFNATNSSPSLACRVSKEPIDAMTYRLTFEAGCDNIFGCSPPVAQAQNDFYRFVTDSGSIIPQESTPTAQSAPQQ